MNEILYIRLGSQRQAVVHWLIYSTSEQAVLDSGQLASADAEQLGLLTEQASIRKVIVFVPGSDVLLKSLTVPGKSQRAIRLAAPYMLEDDLAQDVETLFFAYGKQASDEQGHNCFVATVDRQQMSNWLAWLQQANIHTSVMVPDVLALPVPNSEPAQQDQEVQELNYSALALDQQILIRQNSWQGLALDTSCWSLASKAWQSQCREDETRLTLNAYSDFSKLALDSSDHVENSEQADSVAYGVRIAQQEPVAPALAVLAKHCPAQVALNLLQGEYKLTKKRSAVLTHWYWAAGFAVAALVLTLGLKVGDLLKKESQIAAIDQQIISTYKKAFPNTKRVRISTIKSQLKNKMKGVSTSGGSDNFLPLLTKLQPAFALVPELQLESLKFDGKKHELRLQVNASSYQDFEKYSAAVEKMGLKVKQGAQNNQGNRVSGSFSISQGRRK